MPSVSRLAQPMGLAGGSEVEPLAGGRRRYIPYILAHSLYTRPFPIYQAIPYIPAHSLYTGRGVGRPPAGNPAAGTDVSDAHVVEVTVYAGSRMSTGSFAYPWLLGGIL